MAFISAIKKFFHINNSSAVSGHKEPEIARGSESNTHGDSTTTIPEFIQSYPSLQDLNKNQLIFYYHLKQKLDNGQYLDVSNNISYVYLYVYELVSNTNKNDFSSLHSFLIYLSELYGHHQSFKINCRFWANDCLLAQENFEEFLEKSEPLSYLERQHITQT